MIGGFPLLRIGEGTVPFLATSVLDFDAASAPLVGPHRERFYYFSVYIRVFLVRLGDYKGISMVTIGVSR